MIRSIYVLALIVVMIWGTTFVSTKVLLDSGLHPGDIFFVRFLIAYLCMLPFTLRRMWASSIKDELLMLSAGITGGSLYFLTENIALQYSYCSNVSLLVCSTPMLTTLLLGMCYKNERINLKQFLASVFALAGMTLVILNGHFVLNLSPIGDMLALLAAITWAFYSLTMRMLQGKYSMSFITRKIFAYGLLSYLPVFLWHPLQTDIQLYTQPAVWGNLIFLGFIASFICYYAWNVVLVRIGVVRATNFIYLNPVVTLITSHIVIGERITPLALLGAALILGGIAAVEYFKTKPLPQQ